MPEMDDDRIADLVDEQLRYWRGEGPEPDLTVLSDDERAEVLELVELVDALADRLPASPRLEEDPVARRLGLITDVTVDAVEDLDPVAVSAHELVYRFGGAVEIEEPPSVASGRWQSNLVCRSLAEVVLVVSFEADEGYPTASDGHALFADDPRLSAVAFTTPDATAAAVVVPADTVDRLIPTEGWMTPSELNWEPLGIALGRHFERSIPRWEEATSLPPGDLLDDLAGEVRIIVNHKLREVAATGPHLPHKRNARDFVGALDTDVVVAWVDSVRARRVTGQDLVSELSSLCAEGSP